MHIKHIISTMLLLLAFLVSWPLKSHAADEVYDRVMSSGTIKCGYTAWPPFISKDPNSGKMVGMLVEVIEEIGKSLDLKIDWSTETGVGNYTEDLNSNRIDMMCTTLWADGPRIKSSLLIDPILYSGVYLVVRKDDHRFDKDFHVLNSKALTMTGIDSDITATLAARLFPESQKMLLPSTASPSELMVSVKTKKADATFSDLGFFSDYDKQNPGQLKILKQNPAWIFGERLAVKNGETRFKYILDTAIQELINSGKIDEIMKKYPGTSTMVPKKDY